MIKVFYKSCQLAVPNIIWQYNDVDTAKNKQFRNYKNNLSVPVNYSPYLPLCQIQMSVYVVIMQIMSLIRGYG
ncbi:hypothetical protein CE91St49_38960 [Emergencia timonensis]|nr:hypothetical protein CE91St49_38960 [Emergencia timonensis]